VAEGDAGAVEKQAAREAAATWISNTRRDILDARVANKKIIELQDELDAAIERITCLDIENQSLRASLDLASSESERSDRNLSQLKELLHQTEDRFHRLESDHSIALLNTRTLLRTCKTREEALVCAEEKLESLIELFVRLDSTMADATARSRVQQSSRKQDLPLEAAIDSDEPPEPKQPTLWQRDLDTDDWLLKPREKL
jgi:regulator of replication initiation timing